MKAGQLLDALPHRHRAAVLSLVRTLAVFRLTSGGEDEIFD